MENSVLDLIGNTPLVVLDRIHPGPGHILTKADFLQPGCCVKDRTAKEILLAARVDGLLHSGMPVMEMTRGNMGAGLAVVCAALDHPFIATMSAGNSPARARMMKGLGHGWFWCLRSTGTGRGHRPEILTPPCSGAGMDAPDPAFDSRHDPKRRKHAPND